MELEELEVEGNSVGLVTTVTEFSSSQNLDQME